MGRQRRDAPWRRVSLVGALTLMAAFSLLPTTCLVHRLGGAFSHKPHEIEGGLGTEAQALLDRSLADIDPAALRDYHVHLVGLGAGETGAFVNPEMQSWASPIRRFKLSVYMSASGVEDETHADRQYVERLATLVRSVDRHGKVNLMAFDKHYRRDGSVDLAKTELYTPNAYAFAVAEEFPDLFDPVISVHPYREDALVELERWARRGGRFVKWLPNAMGIDPADPKCDPYYDKMKELGLILMSHAGEEQAVEAEEDQELGNPLRLRRALDRGVKVIVAHCASLGQGDDLDAPGSEPKPSFQLFLRLMGDPGYVGLVFGDLSSMIQFNRLGEPLTTMLERDDLHGRLVNGSDYPLPAVNVLVSTGDLVEHGYITDAERAALNEIYDYNPLLFDYVAKRTVKHPQTGQRFPPSVFMAHPEL